MNNLVKTSKSVNLFNIQTCAVHLAQVAARLLSPPPPLPGLYLNFQVLILFQQKML